MESDRDDLVEIATGAALSHLSSPDPTVRRLAVSACASHAPDETVREALVDVAGNDPDEAVRAEAVEVLAAFGAFAPVWEARLDPSARVVEAAATALGELGSSEAVEWLLEAATQDGDKLVREAAVASLGAIGSERALAPLAELAASGPPQLRRRAVVALTAFDDPRAEAAIRAALLDRNPMVREVAEQIMGR